MAEDRPEPAGIPGDPEAIRSHADALERASKAQTKVVSVLADRDRALLMGDGEWLALATELEAAERELAQSVGGGEGVWGRGPLAGELDKFTERMVAGLADQRRGLEELWALARRERPNN